MNSPEEINEWLKKMQYSKLNPSTKSLNVFCRYFMASIFSEIMELEPKQEVKRTKQNIFYNQMTHMKSKYKMIRSLDDIEEVKVYNQKRNLEADKYSKNSSYENLEQDLQRLQQKMARKNAKAHSMKQEIKENYKLESLYRAKSFDLNTEIQSITNIQNGIKNNFSTEEDKENGLEKVTLVLSKISEIIDKNYDRIQTFDFENANTLSVPFNSSILISSIKKPLKRQMQSNSAKKIDFNSTRKKSSLQKNIFDSFIGVSMISTISRKKNSTKNSISDLNCMSFNSTFKSLPSERNLEILKEISKICFSEELKTYCEEIWHLGWPKIWMILIEMKNKDKKILKNLISEKSIKRFSAKHKYDNGLEKLYGFHIESELSKFVFKNNLETICNGLDISINENLTKLTELKANKYSLQIYLSQIRLCISKLQEELSEKTSNELYNVLSQIKESKSEMETIKSKIETKFSLLNDCSFWLERSKNKCFEKRKNLVSYGLDYLNNNFATKDTESFFQFPFLTKNQQYLDSWKEIYTNPDLLKIIQRPYLSPEAAILKLLKQKSWLQKLICLENSIEKADQKQNWPKIPEICLSNSRIKLISEKLQKTSDKSNAILRTIKNEYSGLKVWLEISFNDCEFGEFNGKTLKQYVEEYEISYKQLKQINN